MLRDTGNYETIRSTNVLTIQSLRGENSSLEKGGITREEQIKIDEWYIKKVKMVLLLAMLL